MDTLTTDRVGGLAVRRTGTGEPVLMLHGSGGGLHSLAGLAAELTGFEVWRCARRGYRPSPGSFGRNTFDSEVRDVRALLETVRAVTESDVHLVGVGYGASLALHTAASEPAGIRSLALVEPPVLLAGPHLEAVLTRYRGLVADGDFRAAQDLLSREVDRVPEPLLAALSTLADPDPVRARAGAAGWVHDLEALAGDDADPARWVSLRTQLPVLLAQGAHSREPVPAGMDALAAALPHARRVVWEGQVHGATGAAPAVVARTLREFYSA
ncbi:alpha/beta fold hydrolase [Kineococcus rhizosphaerae]|uniref:Alpha-beta hydrolase superfamily lysophospholipase n=1 Tax=Kineococcus rhizosphaerae TaxID=559628 RepID=A0A2T0QYW8_9ACTN|nr:alpha/beta fold hydrolase [Kineococcus rhizosphaerae]PRY11704.1 alpha-beta hydrolase superfamily lysophospholipase [Kineococcus rhizosphaerae]